jgi:hypothetical protein
MENTKNFFENWAETQKTMLDNLTEKTQQFQNNVAAGQAFAKGTEMYQDWMNKQKETIKSFTKGAEKTTENIKDEATHTFDNFLDQWKNVQEKTAEMWSDTTKKMNEFFSGFGVNTGTANGFAETLQDNARKFQESWMSSVKDMTSTMKMPFDMPKMDFSGKTISDTYNSMLKGSENFTKLYKLWAPVFKAAQNNVFSTDEYKKLMNPVLYKELMDKMFGFDALNPLKQYYEQYSKTVSGMFDNMTGTAKENYNTFKANMEQFANTLPQNQAYFADMMTKMNEQMKSSVSPFFKLMPDGKEKDQIMQMNQLSEYYIAAANKLAKLQYIIYVKGAKVNEELMAELAENAKDGKADTDFTAFYNNWISVNGKAFENLFRTDEFSKLQGELLTLDAQIRTASDKIVEGALAPYPVVLKSQLDELYKANYDLKKQVYEMSKQMATLVKNAATATTHKTEAHKTETAKKEETPAAKTPTTPAAKATHKK